MTLSEQVAAKLTEEEKQEFNTFATAYQNSSALQARVYGYQIADIANQAITATEAAQGADHDMMIANLTDAAQFLDEKYEAWALGNRHYIIRSTVRVIDPEKGQVDRLFACKVRMIADNEADPSSWSLLGVDFNESSN